MTKIFKKLSNNLNRIDAGSKRKKQADGLEVAEKQEEWVWKGLLEVLLPHRLLCFSVGGLESYFCLLFFCYKLSALIGMWVLPLWLG